MKNRSVIRLIGLLAAASALFAIFPAISRRTAAVTIDETGAGIGFTSVLYDASNGLPTSEANAVAQSADGFIWIGGYSGLIRYDGNDFYRYPSATGIASVVSLFVDSKDRLWIGTNDSGVAMLKDDEFVFYNNSEDQNLSVRSIAEDAKGNILIATTLGMDYVTPEGELRSLNDPQINTDYVCELIRGESGTIFGITLDGDLFCVNDLAVTEFYSSKELGFGTLNTMYPDPENPGWIYLGTQGQEVIRANLADRLKGGTVYSTAPHSTVNAIRRIGEQMWACCDNGIGYFLNGSFVPLLDLPMTNSIDHMMEDYEHNLWFTSSRQGLMKIVENRFVNLSKMAKLDPMVVNSVCRAGRRYYVATDTGLVILNDRYERIENDLTRLLEGVRIRCVKRDHSGKLWFCTYSANGFVGYDPALEEIKCLTEESGLASNRVRMFTQLSDGTLAVATNAGVNLVKDGEVIATFNDANGISNLEILCIEEGRDGVIYVGSDGDGIYAIDGDHLTRIGFRDGLHSEVILRIKEDEKEDLFWIITSNSIGFLKDGKVTTLQNFPYSNNFDLFFDRFDNIWVLSSNGIYVEKREDMLADKDNPVFTFYDTSCGLPGIATANSYSHLDTDGNLVVAATTGIFSVNINTEASDNRSVRLAVPYLVVDDRYYPVVNGAVTIPADARRVNIYANAFTYSLNNPRLSYYLDGFDKGPIETTKQNLDLASYTNLPGGTYRFHFSILNAKTGEPDQTVTVKIIKPEAFYEALWFQILAGAFAVGAVTGIVILIYRRKTKKLLKKHEENRRLINEMTRAFAKSIDMKDAYTNGHSFRVAEYTVMFARRLGKSEEELEEIRNIALLHDIGKISIPDHILNKPGRLDNDEYAVMKMHSPNGRDILKEISIAPDLALGAGCHHERWDGNGYPNGLKGDEIPEVAQIIAVADTFDAMFSTRPYRKKMKLADVAAEIRRCSGTQLNPKVVEVFLQLVDEGVFRDEDETPQEPEKKNGEGSV